MGDFKKLNAPSLAISKEVWEKVLFICNQTNNEVSGFGVIEMLRTGPVVIEATVLNEGESTSTVISADAQAKFDYHMMKDFPDRDVSLWWWHTHPTFSAFWSGTDHNTLSEFLETNSWVAATVLNQKGEQSTSFVESNPFPRIVSAELKIFDDRIESLKPSWLEEYNLIKAKPKAVANWNSKSSKNGKGSSSHFTYRYMPSWELGYEVKEYFAAGLSEEDIIKEMSRDAYLRGCNWIRENDTLDASKSKSKSSLVPSYGDAYGDASAYYADVYGDDYD